MTIQLSPGFWIVRPGYFGWERCTAVAFEWMVRRASQNPYRWEGWRFMWVEGGLVGP